MSGIVTAPTFDVKNNTFSAKYNITMQRTQYVYITHLYESFTNSICVSYASKVSSSVLKCLTVLNEEGTILYTNALRDKSGADNSFTVHAPIWYPKFTIALYFFMYV